MVGIAPSAFQSQAVVAELKRCSMKKVLTGCLVVAALSWNFARAGGAQEELPQQLAAARSVVEREVSERLAGWTHKTVTPMEGSSDLVIDQWHSGKRIVRVALALRGSEEAAARELKDLKSQLEIEDKSLKARGKQARLKDALPDLGNGGLAWDVFGADAVAFKKNLFLVYVTVKNPEEEGDKQMSREIAKLIDKVLRSK